MNFSDHVPNADQNRIARALRDIKRFGDRFQTETAEFLTNTKIVIHLDMASEVGGSGSVQLSKSSILGKISSSSGFPSFRANVFRRESHSHLP